MRSATRETGRTAFTLIEAIAALLALAVVVVHLALALRQLAYADRQRQRNVAVANLLTAKMEELSATPFDALPLSSPPGTPTALSDSVEVPQMGTVAREVIIDRADADGDGADDAGFKQITVRVAGQKLVAMRAGTE
jgi:hypothetical protein